MKIKILLVSLITLFLSCKTDNKSKDNTGNIKSEIKEELKTDVGEIENEVITFEKTTNNERFFPSEKETTKTDTLIKNSNIQITIIKKALDSYVTNEYEIEGVKNIDKYRDYENQIIVKRDGITLVDSTFHKESFKKYTDKEFLEISILHGYWFNEIKDNKIELFGVISKPETDWAFAFQHFFNIETGEFLIVEHIDEEL